MLKYWRIWLLVIMLLASVLAIGFKAFPHGRVGVEVVFVSSDSPLQGLVAPGDVITSLNGVHIPDREAWEAASQVGETVTLIANGQTIEVQAPQGLGVNVIGIERTNLEFGLDLKGGTRIILQPDGNVSEEDVDQTIAVLETRANLFGLQEIKFTPIKSFDGGSFIQIEAAGVGSEVVEELLSSQGKFEAKIVKPVPISSGIATLELGDEIVALEVVEGGIVADSVFVGVNESFTFGGINFEYINTTDRVYLLTTIFGGEDIELVYSDPQRSGVLRQGEVFEFFFSILISVDGATNFAEVTEGIPKFFSVQAGTEYLESPLLLFIDDGLVSSLQIAGSLGGQVIQSPQITGTELSEEEANQEKLRLQTILRSGALPITLTTVSVDSVSPTLGSGFFESAGVAALVAAIVVLVVVFARYRKLKIALPLTLVGISEVVIILGIASTNDAGIWGTVLVVNLALISLAWWKKYEIDVYAWFGAVIIPLIGLASWTIDLPAIAGIMAAIGSGVDHQIIIADEALRGERKMFGVKTQIKRAFFIIMGAAFTTIFAMLPLMFVGVGLVRGFAITTIAGVLVGILITRPAYAKIVERVT